MKNFLIACFLIGVVLTLTEQDARVMEGWISKNKGRDVTVTSGQVVQEGARYFADLQVVSPKGNAYGWKFPLNDYPDLLGRRK